jgi:hypothetical protein
MLLSRTVSPPVGLRVLVLARLMLVLVTVTALWSIESIAITAPASAMVRKVSTGVGSGEVTVGLQPRNTVLHVGTSSEAKQFANQTGAPVLPINKTYAIYWDPTDNYHGDWQAVIDAFFHNMGASSGSLASVYSVDAQYTDAANQHADYASTFMGAYTDTDPYPVSGKCSDPHPLEGTNYPWGEPAAITCITNAQIETELTLFIADHKLPTGMGTIFYLLTPPGVTVCLNGGGLTGHCSDYHQSIYTVGETQLEKEAKEGEERTSYENSFCSYHADINPGNLAAGGPNTVLYADIPWIAGGFGDGHINDYVSGYDCQDGGFDPSSKPIERKEERPERSIEEEKKEEEEFAKMTKEEQKKVEETHLLEGPHQQEPNQVSCPSPDGYCDTGLADLIINQIGVEQQNIVTNPLLDSWKDPSGDELTDECRNFFETGELGGGVAASLETFAGSLFNQTLGAGKYYLNDAFNLAALKLPYAGIPCRGEVVLEPKFTAPNPVNFGEVVGFDGMESGITLNWGTLYSSGKPKPTYASYTWNFGDGSPAVTGFAPGAPTGDSSPPSPCGAEPWEAPCAASAYHSYTYGGTYNVTLTVTDTGGDTASITQPIKVDGPPPPSPESTPTSTPSNTTPGGSPVSGSASSGGGSSPGQTGTASSAPAPVVTASIASTSLKKVKTSGIVVRYSVNEQVAGSVQVLLESSVAKRLGIKGPVATGLATGSPSETVIGTAVLVTTKAGTGIVHIKFASKTAARLARSHKLKLMLRLVARNASRVHPLTTTTLSTVVLSG